MDVFKIVQISFVSLGISGNFLFALTMLARPLPSRITSALIGAQSAVDCIVSLVTLLLLALPAFSRRDDLVWPLNFIICHFWNSQFIYWLLVEVSVQCLVVTAVDRYFAVVRAAKYRSVSTRKMLVSCFCYVICTSVLLAFPVTLEVRMSNTTCLIEPQFKGPLFTSILAAYSVLWSTSVYFAPTLFFLVVYTRIIRQLQGSRTFPSSVTSSSTNDSNKAPKRRLTLSMFIITVIFIICFSFDSVYYLLGRFEVLVYVYNSPIQRVGVILITINSVLNPIIYFSLMKKFRLRMYTLFWTKYKLSDTTVDTS